MEYYYTQPFQVYYLRPDNCHYSFGIAFHEWVVDITDGKPFSIKEILENVPSARYDDTIVEWCHWVDINQWLPI